MEFVNIIRSEVISNKYDVLWDDVSGATGDAQPKTVLILVSECEKDSVEDQQLLKMLGACKLTDEQYNIIRLQKDQQIAWHRLREKLEPKIVFLIGVMPVQLGISAFFKLNEPNNFGDCTWLPTLSIRELEQFADVKKQLWISGMKPLFVDNPLPA
jgi:2-succinyl-5-enolpyruvyl-6-hydroxy-3-cyclohexene-1-carboxylate synthase